MSNKVITKYMIMKKDFIKYYLMLSGSIPFVLFSGLICFGVNSLPLGLDPVSAINSYALVIASFMVGVYWGQYISHNSAVQINLLIISNVIAVMLWLSYLLLPPQANLLMIMAIFILLLLVDYQLYRFDIITKNYMKFRVLVTFIVVLSLFVAGVIRVYE